jgi:hypothetical protein
VPAISLTSAVLAFAVVLSVSATDPGSAASPSSLPRTPTSTSSGISCAVTRPRKEAATPSEASFGAAGFNYGNKRLRAQLYWPDGTLRAGLLPGGGSMATINRNGSISVKLGWWVRDLSKLVIRGRRLDRPGAPLSASIPAGYGPTYSLGSSLGFQPTSLTFPTGGCWRVVGQAGPASLTFVVRVIKLKSSVR